MAKKLWAVTVTCEVTMPVWAESAEDAEEIARDFHDEEPGWGDSVEASACEVTSRERLPRDFNGALPWGGDDDGATCETLVKSEGLA